MRKYAASFPCCTPSSFTQPKPSMNPLSTLLNHRPLVEILEARIAPSVFFIEANGSVVNSSGASVDDALAAGLVQDGVHLTVAVDLHAGDSLYFDPTNTHVLGHSDIPL